MRIAIIAGICVPHDAISAAVASQAELVHGLPEVERVTVFAKHIGRQLPCEAIEVADPWALLRHPIFQQADIAIFHWGIHYSLFDALILLDRSGPTPICHFHNCTPAELCTADDRPVIECSLRQLELVPSLGTRVWTYSRFNELTLEQLGVPASRIGWAPFPIEPPRALDIRKEPGRIDAAIVGRLVPAKGVHVAIAALPALGPERLERLRVRIAGNASFSDDAYMSALREQVTELGLDDVVEFIGQPDDEGLWQLFELSHLLISPSFHEGLCVPVIEAYAAGCRVIGTTAGNLPYIVSPADRVVPPDDPAALTEALAATFDELLTGTPHDDSGAAAVVQAYSRRSAETAMRQQLGHLRSLCFSTAQGADLSLSARDHSSHSSPLLVVNGSSILDVGVQQQQTRSQLCAALVCPKCRTSVDWLDEVLVNGVPFYGQMMCEEHGDIGAAMNGKYFFGSHRQIFDSVIRSFTGRLLRLTHDWDNEHFESPHRWIPTPDAWVCDVVGERASFNAKALGATISFRKHPWAGAAEIRLDGDLVGTIDLFEPNGSLVHAEQIYLGNTQRRIEVVVSEGRDQRSRGNQVNLVDFQLHCIDEGAAPTVICAPTNWGNPYPAYFDVLLQSTPADGLVLDCGAGDRSHPDPRVVGFEYCAFREPTVFGDGHALPFADASFDAVLSQAVLEHVYDPYKAASEICRVLKPGGRLYVESAFMQPLHAVPFHFFNTTGWALERLFEELEIERVGHEGPLHHTLRWFYSLTALREKGQGGRLDALLREVEELDAYITPEELRYFSSFVTLKARKRS